MQDRVSGPLAGIQKRIGAFQRATTQAARHIGTGFLMAGGAVLGLVGALKPAADFEGALNRIAISGDNAAEILARMRVSALALNASLGGGAVTNLELLEQAHRLSGLAGDELERMARNTRILAGRFRELDQTKLLAVQTALMREFRLDATGAGDAIAFMAGQGGDLRDELLDSLLEYSVQFRELGFGVRQQIAVVQTALATGWNLDKGLDVIKEGGIKIREMGIEQESALHRLGLGGLVTGIQSGEVAVVDAMVRIGDRVRRIAGETEKFQLLQALFGTPAEDFGVDATLKMLAAIARNPEVAGAMKNLSLGFSDAFPQQLAVLTGNVENLAIAVGSTLLPIINPLVIAMTTAAERLNAWAQRFPNLTRAVGLAALGFLLLIFTVGMAKIAFGALFLAWTGLGLIFGGLLGGAKLLGSALLILATNPIGLVIAGILAIGAAVVAIIVYWDELKTAAGASADWIIDSWNAVGVWFADLWESLPREFGFALGVVAAQFTPDAIIERWEVLKTWFTVFWSTLEKGFGAAVDSIVQIFTGLPAQITEIWNAIPGFGVLLNLVSEGLGGAFDFVPKGLGGAADRFTEGFAEGFEGARTAPQLARQPEARVVPGGDEAIRNINSSSDNRRRIDINRLTIEMKDKVAPDMLARLLAAEAGG